MRSKRAEIGTSTLIILIATVILITGILFSIFNYLDLFSSNSYQNVKLSESSLSKGFTIFNVDAYDGTNGYFQEFYADARLLPDSSPIAFDATAVLVRMSNWSASLVYRSGSPVQNDSGYVSYTNGTGFYQVSYLITSDFHQDDEVVRGESVRFHIHVPGRVYGDDTFSINVVTANGVSYPVTVFTGDTIPSKELVSLYPRI